jgi:hypothetical protein
MVIEKVIHGYEITLDTDCDGSGDDSPDRVTGCWINKEDFSGSLEWLLAYGSLDDSEGRDHPVRDHTIDTINNWALAHGY